MKSVVTKETAEALKKAGFVQPVPEFGMAWYHTRADYVGVVTYLDLLGMDVFFKDSIKPEYIYYSGMSDMAFAPTATDILKELGSKYHLEYHQTDDIFAVWADHARKYHPNPAEAAAIPYLAKHPIP